MVRPNQYFNRRYSHAYRHVAYQHTNQHAYTYTTRAPTGIAPRTNTPTPPPGTTATPTSRILQFSDVPPTNPFYLHIRCLVCGGMISGYADNTFRPGNDVTRGQLSKIVSNAASFSEPVPTGQQKYADVPNANPFWIWIERLAGRGIISGYGCGGPDEPCDPQYRPYFRSASSAGRGQISKIVANTFFPGCSTP
jgi:hypothetical protein